MFNVLTKNICHCLCLFLCNLPQYSVLKISNECVSKLIQINKFRSTCVIQLIWATFSQFGSILFKYTFFKTLFLLLNIILALYMALLHQFKLKNKWFIRTINFIIRLFFCISHFGLIDKRYISCFKPNQYVSLIHAIIF